MQKLTRMGSKIYHGQRLEGHKALYKVLRPLSRDDENLWLARYWILLFLYSAWLMIDSDPNSHVVLIKTAPPTRIENEIEALKLCRGHKSVRQLVDVIDNPQSLVLEYLDKSLYEASCEQKLDSSDVKRAVKSALDGLAVLHAHKRAHTGQYQAITLRHLPRHTYTRGVQTSNRTTSSQITVLAMLDSAPFSLATSETPFQRTRPRITGST